MIGAAIPVAIAGLVAIGALQACAVLQVTAEGRGSAVAADTLRLGEATIRLAGIAAPEADMTCLGRVVEPCARRSQRALADLLAGAGAVRCTARDRDRHGTTRGDCRIVSTGTDVATWMVLNGWAVGEDEGLRAMHHAALFARVGLWSMPRAWPAPADPVAEGGGGGRP
ncbi:MAG: thermonuclease family protein [Alphaproteobacteria bacterium]